MPTLRELAGLLSQPKSKPSLLGALQDPLFYKDMGENFAGLLGTPTPTEAEYQGLLSMLRLGPSVMQSYPSKERQLMQSHDQKMISLAQMAAPITYHGSPHKFDAFDSTKIGTGEGNQAFGHGLYLSENPNVAKQYQFAGRAAYANNQVAEKAYRALEVSNGDEVAAKAWLHKRALEAPPDLRQQYFDAMNNFNEFKSTANLYTVDLPDEAVSKMLDWDKPLSQQPALAKAIFGDRVYPDGSPVPLRSYDKVSAAEAYHMLSQRVGGDKAASAYLAERGFPGIRYLDGGSRGAGSGTSNYVVFDDKLPKILKRE